jgi:serine/threonine protein kinase
VFGWWGNTRLRQTIEAQLSSELSTTLDANVTALEIWTTNQTRLAGALANEPELRALAARALEKYVPPSASGRRSANQPEVEEFEAYLRPRLEGIGYGVAHLVSTNLLVVANSMPGRARMRPNLAVFEEHVAKFNELFATGQPVVITPFKTKPPGGGPGRGFRMNRNIGFRPSESPGRPAPDGPPPDSPPPQRGGSTNEWAPGLLPPGSELMRFRLGDMALMQVAAPIRDDSGTIRGALALIIKPDAEFTRILSVARSGESGETYAFDEQGLMISRSRFDDQLKSLGLIENRPEASSALNVRLSDPGVEHPRSIVPEDLTNATRGLTLIVSNAVAGGSGVNLIPSRDYRGVPVVGAWRWLPQQGFGVVAQIDADEAYRPLRMLKLLFLLLFLLLVLCATGMFIFSYANIVWRRRLSEAELKLKQLGQYTLEEKIGEGGMGVVYRARHALMRRDTAVKLLLPDRADPDSIQRFEREVCLTCQLSHPNTIQVFDYGHTPDGIFYYAMEYLTGLNLHNLIAQYGPQPEARVIYILTHVCDALAEAHAMGLVHRDIKPANVFLCDRGGIPDFVKVLDFGLVREFRSGKRDGGDANSSAQGAEGTPSFMPPEVIGNSSLSDPRSDIYSLGALGYCLLTGKYVFAADSLQSLYEKHLKETPIPPGQRTSNPISHELEETILRCLEKEPNLRPESALELRALLMTSPHASDWNLRARSEWWARHRGRISSGPTAKVPSDSTHLDATVKIDFAAR